MHVMKFGGSCLQSTAGIRRIADVLSDVAPPVVVVVSALYGVTEKLISAGEAALDGQADSAAVRAAHDFALQGLEEEERASVEQVWAPLFDDLERCLLGASYLGDLSERTRDRIHSFGERLSAPVVAAWLQSTGLPSRWFSDLDAGVLTDDRHQNATILDEAWDRVPEIFVEPLYYVVTGFCGRNRQGDITTLGRGGSDYTASFLASALGCPLTLFKDVPCVMSADPKLVSSARAISVLHYLDALELSHYGLKIIQEKSLLPAMERQIPIHIRGIDGTPQSTTISKDASTGIAISCVEQAVMVDLVGLQGSILRLLSELFTALADESVFPLLLTEASPRGETSVVLSPVDYERVRPAFMSLESQGLTVELQTDLSVVSVIGSGMKGKIGLAARVFEALAHAAVNIVAISQTASERNISVIVSHSSVREAVGALHRVFVEEE